jgi:hypothetical protein
MMHFFGLEQGNQRFKVESLLNYVRVIFTWLAAFRGASVTMPARHKSLSRLLRARRISRLLARDALEFSRMII